ncbi:MAG: indole-3-glycerol phosphate synthase TrpC [Acidobacteria bacterium]|nr:indole-3-glycerol phosphate synthase TrpC [Acidobacteriota bacterium]
MASTYLDSIVAWHRARAQRDTRSWRERLEVVKHSGVSLYEALRSPESPDIAVIAEIKRRSPSKGWLGEHLDASQVALAYAAGGARALSVLTDGPHFAGSINDLREARSAVSLPILRKDFTVSVNDVLDGAEMGASAVLLIVAALEPEELAQYMTVAAEIGLDALVEVHDDDEARIAVDLGARIIGVNQRDLHTFEVNPDNAARVRASLPRDVVTVAESGMASRNDVENAAAAGFDAVLVGEAFVSAPDPSAAVELFATVKRVGRE